MPTVAATEGTLWDGFCWFAVQDRTGRTEHETPAVAELWRPSDGLWEILNRRIHISRGSEGRSVPQSVADLVTSARWKVVWDVDAQQDVLSTDDYHLLGPRGVWCRLFSELMTTGQT